MRTVRRHRSEGLISEAPSPQPLPPPPCWWHGFPALPHHSILMIVGFVERRLWLRRMALSFWYPQDSKQMENHSPRLPRMPSGARWCCCSCRGKEHLISASLSPARGRAGCMNTRSFPRNEPHLLLEGHLSLIELL